MWERMPGKTQNPDSWFYKARVAAGCGNAASLAQRLGVPKVTLCQWERGSADASPSHRPAAQQMLKLRGALGVDLPELVNKLWREDIGDPCPCGCGGKKVFPEEFPQTHQLVIGNWGQRTFFQDKVSPPGLAMKKKAKQEIYFAVCINNKRYQASLEVGKLYRIIPDEEAEAHGYLRVVDESGEDYGYSADRFFRLEVPGPLERALLRASS